MMHKMRIKSYLLFYAEIGSFPTSFPPCHSHLRPSPSVMFSEMAAGFSLGSQVVATLVL